MSDTNIKGLAELQAALYQLPAKIEANIMRGALRAGAKVIQKEAQSTAAFIDRSGALRDSIRVTTKLRSGTATAAVVAGPSKKDKRPFYGRFIEFGTKPHVIKAKNGRALAIGFASVHHPGIRPHPFMRPALDVAGVPAVEAVREYIRQRLLNKHGIDVPAPLEEGDE